MKKYLLAGAAFIILAGTGIAIADLTVKDASGTNTVMFDFLCFTTKHCSTVIPIDTAGAYTPLATSAQMSSLIAAFNANGRASSANSSPIVPSAAPTTWHLVSAASTNATSVKASAATLFSCQLGNIGSTVAYLKIYNKASSPTVGTDTPVKTLIIPKAGTAADGAGSNISFGPGGLALGTGFAAAIVAGITVASTTAVAASEVIVNCDYE